MLHATIKYEHIIAATTKQINIHQSIHEKQLVWIKKLLYLPVRNGNILFIYPIGKQSYCNNYYCWLAPTIFPAHYREDFEFQENATLPVTHTWPLSPGNAPMTTDSLTERKWFGLKFPAGRWLISPERVPRSGQSSSSRGNRLRGDRSKAASHRPDYSKEAAYEGVSGFSRSLSVHRTVLTAPVTGFIIN